MYVYIIFGSQNVSQKNIYKYVACYVKKTYYKNTPFNLNTILVSKGKYA